jgi:hypothetical protein
VDLWSLKGSAVFSAGIWAPISDSPEKTLNPNLGSFLGRQIIAKLREAEVMLGKGMPMEEALRQLGISDATYYKWRKELDWPGMSRPPAACQSLSRSHPSGRESYDFN